jgi:hypothetical protein
VAGERLALIEKGSRAAAGLVHHGWDEIHFAWAGAVEPGKGHYYRLEGPSFVVEFVTIQSIIEKLKASLKAATSGGGFSLESLFASFAGKRASGGPVSAGSGYLVGEQGPEFFIPAVSAMLHPEMIPAIMKSGRHEIGVHGWIHEFPPALASAAEEEMFVELLGLTNRTVPVVASEAITLGADLYATDDGKVGLKPTAAGTYWKVGKALQPADADGDVFEMQPQKPRKLIVVSALESTNGTFGAAADQTAQNAEGEKLGDDLRKIAAALNGDADVALATT